MWMKSRCSNRPNERYIPRQGHCLKIKQSMVTPGKPLTVKKLNWNQVNAWRLSRHCLSPRLQHQDFVKAVTRTGGIQAQVLSAAELALWARAHGLSRQDIQTALWQEHTLVKTWAMRGTLHLLSADELPLYVAARSQYDNRNWAAYFAYYSLTPAQQEAFIAAVPQVLGREPMTRQQLATAIAEHTGIPPLREVILASGWGSPLKPSAFRGDLCFGPSQGQNVTFVNPRAWIGNWQSIESELALQEIVRRYLETYGPATPEGFARWWWGGGGVATAKKVFRALGNELEEVDVEGWRANALRATLEPMQRLTLSDTVHLLPLFDAYLLGLAQDIQPLLPDAYKSQVFRPQGWISAVILVNGYIKGVWQYKTRRLQTLVKVHPFLSLTSSIKEGIEDEAERLGDFLNTDVVLAYD